MHEEHFTRLISLIHILSERVQQDEAELRRAVAQVEYVNNLLQGVIEA